MHRSFATLALLIGSLAPAAAADAACLSRSEQRAVIAKGQAVPLAAAIRAAKATSHGRTGREVVNAELCRRGKGLVYVLTVLAPNGKVSRSTVDAGSGRVVDGH